MKFNDLLNNSFIVIEDYASYVFLGQRRVAAIQCFRMPAVAIDVCRLRVLMRRLMVRGSIEPVKEIRR